MNGSFIIEQQKNMNPFLMKNDMNQNHLKKAFEIEKKSSRNMMENQETIRPNFHSVSREENNTIRPNFKNQSSLPRNSSMDGLDLLMNSKNSKHVSRDEQSRTSAEYEEDSQSSRSSSSSISHSKKHRSSSEYSTSSSSSKSSRNGKDKKFPLHNFQNISKKMNKNSKKKYQSDNDNSSQTSRSSNQNSGSGSGSVSDSGSDSGSGSGSGSESVSGSESKSSYTDDESGSMVSTVKEKDIPKTYEEILREKQKCLDDIKRLIKRYKFDTMKEMTLSTPLEEIRSERERLKRERDMNQSLKFQRKILIALSAGVEWLSCKKGFSTMDKWSESVMENIDDYDEVFEELFDKYNTKVSIAPEMKLLGLVFGSAAMHHFSNSLFKSAVPNLSDILRTNPDLMRNISEAALNTPQMAQNPLGSFVMRQGVNMYADNLEQKNQVRNPPSQSQNNYQQTPQSQNNYQQSPQSQNNYQPLQNTNSNSRMKGPTDDVSDILHMLKQNQGQNIDPRTIPAPLNNFQQNQNINNSSGMFQSPTIPIINSMRSQDTQENPFSMKKPDSDTDSIISISERKPNGRKGKNQKKENIQLNF